VTKKTGIILGALALAALLAITLTPRTPPHATTVDASRYDAFWLWSGVKPQPVLAHAKRLYLLYGEVTHDPVRLVAQRPAVPHVQGPELWMAVRVETLAWTPEIHAQLQSALARWRAAGNRLAGIQIDFDAGTRHLEDYAAFLRDLRQRLPKDCKLGVTGLLDWSANADPAGLDALAGTVDEVVLQIYQGRRVIPGYAKYLAKLGRLRIPFRIGLLQGGEWHAPPGLEANPMFRGYVVFLQNGQR
jgi:hypothetical protein